MYSVDNMLLSSNDRYDCQISLCLLCNLLSMSCIFCLRVSIVRSSRVTAPGDSFVDSNPFYER